MNIYLIVAVSLIITFNILNASASIKYLQIIQTPYSRVKVFMFFLTVPVFLFCVGYGIGLFFIWIFPYKVLVAYLIFSVISIRMIISGIKYIPMSPLQDLDNLPSLLLMIMAITLDFLLFGVALGYLGSPVAISVLNIVIIIISFYSLGLIYGGKLKICFSGLLHIYGGVIILFMCLIDGLKILHIL